MDTQIDLESLQERDQSDWKMDPHAFQMVRQVHGKPEMDVSLSRHSRQLLKYITWGPDPCSYGTDAMQENWFRFQLLCAFPPFCIES